MLGSEVRRRWVTVLFSDLCDSTGIAAQLEPEQFVGLIESFRAAVDSAVSAHGGQIVRLDGDGCMCVFGHLEPQEDAGRRAVEAALDLHQGLGAFPAVAGVLRRPLSLHSGIHSGLVILRPGDIVRGRYEVLGDATNTAARLRDAAAAGEILVSVGTLGRDQPLFQGGAVKRLRLSGHEAPLAVRAITGRVKLPTRPFVRGRAGATPFQGRQAQVKTVMDWLLDDAAPHRVLVVHGQAGIGKSRFIREIMAHCAAWGWQAEAGCCEAYLAARPLHPFLQMVAGQEEIASAHPADAATRMAERFMLRADAARLLVVVDDWQWADDATRGLLHRLLDTLPAGRLRVLLASREADPRLDPGIGHALLALPPLSSDETALAVAAILRQARPFMLQRIHEAAGGSPLLVEELCLALASGTPTPLRDPRGPWFDLAVQARLALLPPPARALLDQAAAIGRVAPAWLLTALHGGEPDSKLIQPLLDGDFLHPGGAGAAGDGFHFKHGLTRDAVYAAIGLYERRAMHARILAALESRLSSSNRGELIDAMAFHAAAAGAVEPGLGYAIEAGDAALASGALDRAQAHYQAGIELAEQHPDAALPTLPLRALLNKFGLACIVDPAPDQLRVLASLRQMLRRRGSPSDLSRAAYWQGALAYGMGWGRRSVTHLREALAVAEQDGNAREIELVNTKLAQSLFAAGQYPQAAALFDRLAVREGGTVQDNDRERLAYGLACHGFMHADMGGFGLANRLFEQAMVVLGDPDRPMMASVLSYQASALLWQGDWAGALQRVTQAQETSRRSRTRHQHMMTDVQAAYARWQLDRQPARHDDLVHAAALFMADGQSQQRASMVLGWWLEAEAEAAAVDRSPCRRLMARVIQRQRIDGDRLGEAWAWRVLARAHQALGDPVRADRCLHLAGLAGQRRHSRREAAHDTLCRGQLCLARGRGDDAAIWLAQAAAEFTAMAMPVFAAQAQALVSSR